MAELKAIASAATQPGPWTTNESDTGETTVLDAHGMWVAECGFAPDDAAHIAAFSPSTCLELLARLEAVTKARDEAVTIALEYLQGAVENLQGISSVPTDPAKIKMHLELSEVDRAELETLRKAGQ